MLDAVRRRSSGTDKVADLRASRPPAIPSDSDARQHSSHAVTIKGPLTTPVGGGFRSVNVRMREEFGLYANVRPVRTDNRGTFEDIDIVLIRENIEGLYVVSNILSRSGTTRAPLRSHKESTPALNACGSPDMHLNMPKAWAQEGHHRSQGKCPESANRPVLGMRAVGRQGIRRPDRDERQDRRSWRCNRG